MLTVITFGSTVGLKEAATPVETREAERGEKIKTMLVKTEVLHTRMDGTMHSGAKFYLG